MRLYRTDPKKSDHAALGWRMDEHVDDVTGHVFIEPKDTLGRRVEPARNRLDHTAPGNRLDHSAPSILWLDDEAGFRF